jgi:hypothetical protein
MANLVEAGVVSIHASFFKTGIDVYGRVVQPHPRLGISPHESYQIDELEQMLNKVQVHESVKSGGSSGGAPLPTRGDKSPVGVRAQSTLTPPSAGKNFHVIRHFDERLSKQVPYQIVMSGVANILPVDSISWKDLAFLSQDDLELRIHSVSAAIGAEKAWARISTINSSMGSTLPAFYDLNSWWEGASPQMRFNLISSSKKAGEKPSNSSKLLSRVSARCPFRDSHYPREEEAEEEEENEDLSWEEQAKLFGTGSF